MFIQLTKYWLTIIVFTISIGFGESSYIVKSSTKSRDSIKPEFTIIHPLDDDRIVGGAEAGDGQFPFQASIQSKFSSSSTHFCGGSFISQEYVVTAAHCAKGRKASSIWVLGGSIVFNDAIISNVSKIVIHPDYNSATVTNDIAILKLGTPISGVNIEPIPLPNYFQETSESTSCLVSGWGTTSEGGILPDTLRYVRVDIIGHTKCREQYGETSIADSMICAGFNEGAKDSCQGDSGGPLVCDGKLIGIVSWGYGCARPNYPGVYTQVSHFTDWINEQISNSEKY